MLNPFFLDIVQYFRNIQWATELRESLITLILFPLLIVVKLYSLTRQDFSQIIAV